MISTQARFAAYFWRLQRLVWKVKRDPDRLAYRDLATAPVAEAGESEELEMFTQSEAAQAAVAKAKRETEARERHDARATAIA